MIFSGEAVNFSYLLLEYYKKLGIDEISLTILLMIDHINGSNPTFVSPNDLCEKMNCSKDVLDDCLTRLYKQNYIELITKNGQVITSVEPIKKIAYELFKETIFKDAQISEDKNLEATRQEIFSLLESSFNRSLKPTEISRVNQWISEKTDKKIIIDSIKEASKLNKLSINTIDRLILNKIRKEDNAGNEIK